MWEKFLLKSLIALLLVVIAIELALYFFINNQNSLNETITEEATSTIEKKAENTNGSNDLYRAFNPTTMRNLGLLYKGDNVSGTASFTVEGKIISIDDNNSDKYISYIRRIEVRDSQEKYPSNYFYIVEGLVDIVEVNALIDGTDKPIQYLDLKVDDRVRITMEWSLTTQNNQEIIKKFVITKINQ